MKMIALPLTLLLAVAGCAPAPTTPDTDDTPLVKRKRLIPKVEEPVKPVEVAKPTAKPTKESKKSQQEKPKKQPTPPAPTPYMVSTKENPYTVDPRIIQSCVDKAKADGDWKDPESIRSEGTSEGVVNEAGGGVVYLNINAKNSYGAYAGSQRMVCFLLDGKAISVGKVAKNAGVNN